MRLTTTCAALQAALRAAGRACASKPPIPVLGGILLAARGSSCVVEAYDLSVGVRAALQAAVEAPGAVVAPYRALADLVGRLEPSQPLLVATEGGQLVVAQGTGRYSLALAGDPDDWPGLPPAEGEQLTLPLGVLRSAVGTVRHAAAHADVGRPEVAGVFLRVRGADLEVVALDGHRICALSARDVVDGENEAIEVILPGGVIPHVEKLDGAEDAPVELYVSGGRAVFSSPDATVFTTTIDATYPPYKQLKPKSFNGVYQFNSVDMKAAIERALVVAEAGSGVVRLSFIAADECIKVTAENSTGSTSDVVSVKAELGEDREFGFKGSYLIDMLRCVKGANVVMQSVSNVSVAYFNGEAAGLDYGVMPMRVAE